jgi:hypothetical protein
MEIALDQWCEMHIFCIEFSSHCLRNMVSRCGDLFLLLWRHRQTPARAATFVKFLARTQWHIIIGSIPLDKWSARRRELYLTTYNTYKTQTSVHLARFEAAIPAGERLQTHGLDRSATGINVDLFTPINKVWMSLIRLSLQHACSTNFVKTPQFMEIRETV